MTETLTDIFRISDMRFLQAIFTTLAVGTGFSRASLYTTQPVSGTVFHAGELSKVSWIDNGTSPALAELKPLKLELYGTADVCRDSTPLLSGLALIWTT